LIIACLFSVTIVGPLVGHVTAATKENCENSTNGKGFLGFPTWYKYLTPTYADQTTNPPAPQAECNLTFHPKHPEDYGKIVLALIEILLRVAALVALVFVVIGGVRFTTSQGQPEATAAARSTLLHALLGLVIAVSATALVAFVGGRFQ
jgi:hypothetical protein